MFSKRVCTIVSVFFLLLLSLSLVSGKGAVPRHCYLDFDGDRYGSPVDITVMEQGRLENYPAIKSVLNNVACESAGPYYEANQLIATSTDCDDTSFFTHPRAEELCDGIDNNCNNVIDDAPGAEPETFESYKVFTQPTLSAQDLDVPLLDSMSETYCQNKGFDSVLFEETEFDEDLQSTIVYNLTCIRTDTNTYVNASGDTITEDIEVNETFVDPVKTIDEYFQLPMSKGSELFYCTDKGFDSVVAVEYETQSSLTASQVKLSEQYPEFTENDQQISPSIGVVNNTHVFQLDSEIVTSVTCARDENLLIGKRNVCDSQDLFTYEYEEDTLKINAYQYFDDTASTYLIPNIFYKDLFETIDQLSFFHSRYREKWSEGSLYYLTQQFDPDKRIEYCEATNSPWDFLESESNSLLTTTGYDNLCCGDDLNDEGFVYKPSTVGAVCVQNPSGTYEWVFNGEPSDFELSGTLSNFVAGNIYEVSPDKISLTNEGNTYDVLATDSGWFVCADSLIDTTLHSSFTQVNPPQIISYTTLGSTHQYICHDTGSGFEFAECKGNSIPFNYFQDSTIGLNSNMLWDSESLSFKDSLVTLADFENDLDELLFTDPNNYLQVSYDSSVKFSGSYSLRVSAPVTDAFGKGLDLAVSAKNDDLTSSNQDQNKPYEILRTETQQEVKGDIINSISKNYVMNVAGAGFSTQPVKTDHLMIIPSDAKTMDFSMVCRHDLFTGILPFVIDSKVTGNAVFLDASGNLISSIASCEENGKYSDIIASPNKRSSLTNVEIPPAARKIKLVVDGQHSKGDIFLQIDFYNKKIITESEYGFLYTEDSDLSESSSVYEDTILKDVSDFDYIAGYVYFDNVAVLNMDIDGVMFNLEEYIIGDLTLDEWLYFKVPLSGTDLTNIAFVIPTTYLNFHKSQSYTYYLDNLHLLDSDGLSYCSSEISNVGSTTFKWISDRDDSKVSCEGAGFGWTGDSCCGDDPNEYFVDEFGMCWDSNPIPLGDRIQPITYFLNDVEYTSYCTESSPCEFTIPRLLPDVDAVGDDLELRLENPNPNQYSVRFKETGLNFTSNIHDTIVVEVSKYIFANIDGQLLLCGDESFVPPPLRSIYTDEINQRISTGVCTVSQFFTCTGEGWESDYPIESYDDGTPPSLESRVNLTYVPQNFVDKINSVSGKSTSGCCPTNFCWNGDYCVEDQSNEPRAVLHFPTGNYSGYRCLEGEWTESVEKYSPDGVTSGFCPGEDQCFVLESGLFIDNGNLSGNPQCIDDGQYFGDYYCDAGVFDSRTKKLFETMQSEFSTSKYTLYCDTSKGVFNYIGNSGGKDINSYISGGGACTHIGFGGAADCVNKFCVMSSEKGIAFGTTLNQDIDAVNYSVKELFDIPSVERCKDSTSLARCSDSDREGADSTWYYDASLALLINSEFEGGSGFKSVFDSIKSLFFGEDIILSLNYEELADAFELNDFIEIGSKDLLYYAKEGNNNQIVAINGELLELNTNRALSYVGVEYIGFDGICPYLKESTQYSVICEEKPGGTYVFILSEGGIPIWTDLTTKLRLFEN